MIDRIEFETSTRNTMKGFNKKHYAEAFSSAKVESDPTLTRVIEIQKGKKNTFNEHFR